MLALKIIGVMLGSAFALFGYFIFFKKKYFLINGFDAAFKEGRKTEDYARHVGLAEFILGVAIFIASVLLIVFA